MTESENIDKTWRTIRDVIKQYGPAVLMKEKNSSSTLKKVCKENWKNVSITTNTEEAKRLYSRNHEKVNSIDIDRKVWSA